MNDSSTIYISHCDDMSQNNSMIVPSSTIDVDTNTTTSKKVAQNRAAQRAFRERKQHYVEDLENKAKQLDECKKIMIQLQADNDCLRKSVARLEAQLKQQHVTLVKPLHPLLPSPSTPSQSSSLSKREKKRQRLLANEKLYKNDDLEPIQLHCPTTQPYQQQQEEDQVAIFIPSNPPNPNIRFLQLLPTIDPPQDQFIHFVEDQHPPPQ